MESFKKVIKIVFGQATPMQLFLACLFGSILGFIPGFSASPLINICLIFLILILNINLGLAIIIFLITKILSFIIEPISFHFGVSLLTGFCQPLFKTMVNTPILAYAGFEYYLVTGGIFIGLILGAILGIILVKLFKSTRNKMAKIQTNSDLYQRIVNKLWIKILTWIILGKSANKVDWVALKEKKLKHPFRISGVVIVMILIILLFAFQNFIQSKMVSNILRIQLEKANGATVNFKHIDLNLANASMSIDGLEIANPNDLNQDRFYAKTLNAKLNIKALLTKRLIIQNIIINQAETNHPRTSKASLYLTKKNDNDQTLDNIIPSNQINNLSNETSTMQKIQIEKYIKNTKKFKSYLQQIQRVLSLLSNNSTDNKVNQSSLSEQIRLYGYADITDNTLIEKVPTLTIQSLLIKGLKTKIQPKALIIKAKNLATEPHLLQDPTTITINSVDKKIYIYTSDGHQNNLGNTIEIKVKDLPAKILMQNIKFNQSFDLQAQNIDFSSNGTWHFNQDNKIEITLPVTLTLNQVRLKSNKIENKMDKLPLSFKIINTLDNPIIEFNSNQLHDILVNAGFSEVKNQLQKQLQNKLPVKLPF